MTAAGDPRGHHARCGPHLGRLAALAREPTGAPLSPSAAAAVAEAVGAVLAEAQAAGHAVTGTGAGEQAQTAEFPAARLDRLTAAATAALTAARNADAAALRRELRRFDTLTAALWTVHRAVAVPPPDSRTSPRPAGTQESPDLSWHRRPPSAPQGTAARSPWAGRRAGCQARLAPFRYGLCTSGAACNVGGEGGTAPARVPRPRRRNLPAPRCPRPRRPGRGTAASSLPARP